MRRHIVPVLLALLALLAVAGCGDDDGGGDEEATATTGLSGDPLVGRTFQASELDGDITIESLVPEAPIRIAFAEDEITVETGCNTLTGSYSLDGPFLMVEDLGGTEMACDPEVMAQETWITQWLTERPGFTYTPPDSVVITRNKALLTLLDTTSADAETDAELAGPTWTADTLIDGESARSLPAGVTATITFADDGTYQVATGCNTGDGTWVEAALGLYAIDPPTLTRQRCEEAAAEVEAAFVAVLDGEVTASIETDRLTLTRAPLRPEPGATTEPGGSTTTTEPDPDAGKGLSFTAG